MLSWNGFSSYIRKKVMRSFIESSEKRKISENDQSTPSVDNDIKSLSLKIPYMSKAGDKLVRTLKRKIQQNLSEKVQIKTFYTTNKLAMFCSVKDKIPEDQKM